MFADTQNPAVLAEQAAEYFGSDKHGSHGKRIDREEAKLKHIKIIDLEDDQELQEEILSLYHLSTIAFEQGPAAKTVMSSNGRMWVKNMQLEVITQNSN